MKKCALAFTIIFLYFTYTITLYSSDNCTSYLDLGNYDKAIVECSKKISANPEDCKAYYRRGLAFQHKGEYNKAIEDYSKAIQINPELVAAYNNRGNVYNDKGEYDKAIEDFTKAIKLYPNFAYAYNNRGVTEPAIIK